MGGPHSLPTRSPNRNRSGSIDVAVPNRFFRRGASGGSRIIVQMYLL